MKVRNRGKGKKFGENMQNDHDNGKQRNAGNAQIADKQPSTTTRQT